MNLRPTRILAVAALLAAAALLAGCASPRENAGNAPTTDTPGQTCAPATDMGGESNQGPGTTGSGTGDVTTADGGDPARPTASDPCGPGASGTGTDGTSTGLGERSGGYSTEPSG